MELRKKVESLVDGGIYRHALFYHFPGGLRFALSEGGSALDMALTALRKASVICADAFEHSATVVVHLQYFAPTCRFEMRQALRELAVAGIAIPRKSEIWTERVAQVEQNAEDVEDYWINVAFELPKSKVQNLLWCAIVSDLGTLGPHPGCLFYLIDIEHGIIVHPYDDRGMDIIGRDKEYLRRLFDTHRDWLLDYDLTAMNATFL